MPTRRIIAIVLTITALPLTILGLIDPLEGGLALLGAIILVLVAWALSRVAVPRLAWIAGLVTVVIGATTIAIAISAIGAGQQPDAGTVMSPGVGMLHVLIWAYRLGVVVTLAGAVVYVVRLFKSHRAAAEAAEPSVDRGATPGL
jgi:hypothetical protein